MKQMQFGADCQTTLESKNRTWPSPKQVVLQL